jgi:hypothetical protein
LGRSLSTPSNPGASIGARLLTFHVKAAEQAHVASMPDTTWPVNGHPPDSSRSHWYTPVSMSSVFLSTLQQLRRTSSCPLPDASSAPFPTRSPRQSSANAAVGGLKPPPAGRLRRANLHLPRSTASRSSTYIELLSTFVTHTSTNTAPPGPTGDTTVEKLDRPAVLACSQPDTMIHNTEHDPKMITQS